MCALYGRWQPSRLYRYAYGGFTCCPRMLSPEIKTFQSTFRIRKVVGAVYGMLSNRFWKFKGIGTKEGDASAKEG